MYNRWRLRLFWSPSGVGYRHQRAPGAHPHAGKSVGIVGLEVLHDVGQFELVEQQQCPGREGDFVKGDARGPIGAGGPFKNHPPGCLVPVKRSVRSATSAESLMVATISASVSPMRQLMAPSVRSVNWAGSSATTSASRSGRPVRRSNVTCPVSCMGYAPTNSSVNPNESKESWFSNTL